MKTTDVYYLMNDTMYVSDKGLCDGIKSAKQFSSYEDAIKFAMLKRHNIFRCHIYHQITQSEHIMIDAESVILAQNCHTNATHIGTEGNPYFYYMTMRKNLYSYNIFNKAWELDGNQSRTDIRVCKK